jgi:hypothetical protein
VGMICKQISIFDPVLLLPRQLMKDLSNIAIALCAVDFIKNNGAEAVK